MDYVILDWIVSVIFVLVAVGGVLIALWSAWVERDRALLALLLVAVGVIVFLIVSG